MKNRKYKKLREWTLAMTLACSLALSTAGPVLAEDTVSEEIEIGDVYAVSEDTEIGDVYAVSEDVEIEDMVSASEEAEQESVRIVEESPETENEEAEELAASDGTQDAVTSFVTALYENFLGRKPDASGMKTWTNGLTDHSLTASFVVYGFVYSKEFQSRPLSNEDYVKVMYRTILGREADKGGLATWVGLLNDGCTRKIVLEGFLNSDEMKKLAANMGALPGSYFSDDVKDRNPKVTGFVTRLYSYCLDRKPDTNGLNNWVTMLVNKSLGGAEAARGFLNSKELNGRGLTDKEYLTILYKTLMDRNPDSSGMKTWTGQLDEGALRVNVAAGFLYSNEFNQICSRYGITVTTGDGTDAKISQMKVARSQTQLVTVGRTTGSNCIVTLYTRDAGGAWQKTVESDGLVGMQGIDKARDNYAATPIGSYKLTVAFGIKPNPGIKMAYTQVDSTHYWVGDCISPRYNQFVSTRDYTNFDPAQGEHLIEYNGWYNYCLFINYNEEGTPFAGSCFFLHCRMPSDSGTGGCVAVYEDVMLKIIKTVEQDCPIVIDEQSKLGNY